MKLSQVLRTVLYYHFLYHSFTKKRTTCNISRLFLQCLSETAKNIFFKQNYCYHLSLKGSRTESSKFANTFWDFAKVSKILSACEKRNHNNENLVTLYLRWNNNILENLTLFSLFMFWFHVSWNLDLGSQILILLFKWNF